MPENIPTVLEVLRQIAPDGIIRGEDYGFVSAVLHLRARGYPDRVVEIVAEQVQTFCRNRCIWTMVEGQRRRVIPGLLTS